jgi:hypothetical protein
MNKLVPGSLALLLSLLGACQTTTLDPNQTAYVLPVDFKNMVHAACGVVISLSDAQALLATLDPRIEVAAQLVASLCHLIQSKTLTRSNVSSTIVTFRGVTFKVRLQ